MRWSVASVRYEKPKPIKPKPIKLGDKKVKIKFAWFPTYLNNTDVVWLEKYQILYEYKTVKSSRKLPICDMYMEGGSLSNSVYDRFCKTETYHIDKWVEIKKNYID